MSQDPETWTREFRTEWVLVCWRTRIVVRTFAYQVRHTLQGMLGAAAGAILVLLLGLCAAGGFFETVPATKSGLDGFLLAAHLWLALPLTLMMSAQLGKVFIKQREAEPLAAFPAIYPALARHRVLAVIPYTAITFMALFYAYFWQLLAARFDNLWLSIPVHLAAAALLILASGVAAGGVGRWLLGAALRRNLRNPDSLVNAIAGTAIGVFATVLLGIIIANKHAPGIFETLGQSAAVTVPLGMIPWAAAQAADEGRWPALIGWLALSGGLALLAIRATYRWSFLAHREITLDLAKAVRRMFVPVFTGRQARWLPAVMSAFWRKDVVVPYARDPRIYFSFHVSLFWWGILTVILANALRNRGNISVAFASTAPVLFVLAATAVLAMQLGVNSLGREGSALTWLRPILSGSQLLVRKLVVNGSYVLAHGFVYAAIAYTGSRLAALDTRFWILLSYAVLAGAVLSTLATALGFLLPDFERRSGFLPGATAAGKYAYLFTASLLVLMTGTAHLLLMAGRVDVTFYSGFLTFELICATAATSLIATGSIRQYRDMEI